MSGTVEEAVAERLTGGRPSQMRAIGAAIVVGFGAALLTYRLLRSGGEEEEEEEEG